MKSTVEKFLKAKEEIKDGIRLVGDVLLVEAMPEPEVKIGSLVIAQGSSKQINGVMSNLPMFVRVLLTGPGYYDDDGKDIPLEIKPGNVIQVARHSVDFFGTFGNIPHRNDSGIGITRQDSARIIFKDDEAYEAFLLRISAP